MSTVSFSSPKLFGLRPLGLDTQAFRALGNLAP
jgi:hypothetical protein